MERALMATSPSLTYSMGGVNLKSNSPQKCITFLLRKETMYLLTVEDMDGLPYGFPSSVIPQLLMPLPEFLPKA